MQATARSSVTSGKRKRDDEDVGDSVQDEAAIKSFERKKSKASNNLDPDAERPQPIIPGASLPSKPSPEPKFTTLAPINAETTRGVKYMGGVPSHWNKVQDSQSSHQSLPPPFDVDGQSELFERFYYRIMNATDRTIMSIGDIINSLSFLNESPSKRLEALYARCCGDRTGRRFV